MCVDELAIYEVGDINHKVAEETQFQVGSGKFNTVMKAMENSTQILSEQLDTDNSIGVQANEA